MAHLPTSWLISKRKLMTLLASASAAVAGARSLPTSAWAATAKKAKFKKDKKTQHGAEEVVKATQDLGLIMVVDFKGDITLYPVGGSDVTIEDEPASERPPDREILGDGSIEIEVYHTNPDCIWVKVGGDEICVKKS